jgi:uncharacterized membrane protein
MEILFLIGGLLILVFGFSLSAYIVVYKTNLKNNFAKGFSIFVIGAVASLIIFVLSVIAVWPPYY